MSEDDRVAARLRGFGPVGLLALFAITLFGPVLEPLGALLALLWAWRSRTPLKELGFVRPRSWLTTIALATAGGVLFKVVMKALVMPLLGAPDQNPAYHFLAGNTAALPAMMFAVIVGAGFGEETVFRGFLFERLGRLLGPGPGAKVAIVVLTSLLFASAHLSEQGIPGAEQALVTGLVFGAIFAVQGRLWPLIVAHAAFDVTAVFMIDLNLESRFAHLIFR